MARRGLHEHKAPRGAGSCAVVAHGVWSDHACEFHYINAGRTRGASILSGWQPQLGRCWAGSQRTPSKVEYRWFMPYLAQPAADGRRSRRPCLRRAVYRGRHALMAGGLASRFLSRTSTSKLPEATRPGSLGRIGTLCGASAFDQWNERREDPVACLDGHELFSVNHVAVNAFIHPLAQDQHLVRSSPQSASSTDVEVRGVDYVEAMTWQSSGDAAVDGDAQRSFWCGILSGLGAAASINVGTRPSRVDRSASAPACPKLCNPLFDGLHRASKLEWASMLASLEPPSGTGPGNGLPSPREDPLAGARVVAARSGEAGS